MKKFFSCILSLILLICPLFVIPSSAAYNASLETSADIVLLVSLDNGAVIFDKNGGKVAAPASLTKITTAILTLENCKNLDEVITIKQSTINAISGTNSSTAGLKPGEEISIRNLLYCLMVKSANEAAVALADYVGGGDVSHFVDMMNEFVQKIGCQNTHFMNPHGLDQEGHYTTAYDLARITHYALSLPLFVEITDTARYTLPASNKSEELNLYTTNWLLNNQYKTYYYKYAHGVKTGTTANAGKCVISTAQKDGYNYLAVVMGAPYEDVTGDGHPDNCALLECKKVFQWAFKNLRLTKVSDPTQIVTVSDVKLSRNTDHIRLVPETEITALVPIGNSENSVLIEAIPEETPKEVKAPIKKGDVLGKARILYAGDEIATVNLVAAEDVSVSPLAFVGYSIKSVFKSKIFCIVFSAILVVLLVYILLIVNHNRQKKKRKPKTINSVRNVK